MERPFAIEKINRIVIFISIILCPIYSLCQSKPVSVLTVNNGLSSGTIESGLYDSRGFIWLGTREGLHRYDGKNIVRYLPDESDSNAIHSLSIVYLAEDRKGQIWMLGENGFEVYLPQENRFKLVINGHYGDVFSYGNIRFFDSLDLGMLTIAFPPGFVFFSLRKHELFKSKDEFKISDFAILEKQWLFKFDSIVRKYSFLENQNYNLYDYHIGKNLFRRIGSDSTALWVSTIEPGGFLKFEAGKKKPEWKKIKGIKDTIFKNAILAMKNYNDSLGICSVNGVGILLFLKQSGEVIKFWDFRTDPSLARISEIKLLFNDPEGRIWFSIMPYGLFVLNPFSPRFQLLKNGVPGSLLYNGLMRSMYCDASGRMWLGYQDGKLQILDPDCNKELFAWTMPMNTKKNEIPPVTSISVLPNGNQLLNRSLKLKIQDRNKLESVWLEDKPTFGVGINLLNKDYPPNAIVLLSSIYESKTLVIKKSIQYYIESNPGFSAIGDVFITQEGYVFVAGLDGHFKLFILFNNEKLVLIDHKKVANQIHSVYQYPGSDSLWLCCSRGLFIYNLCNYQILEVDISKWPSQSLYGILSDKYRNFWISTNGGLVRYNTVSKEWKCFTVKDGLQSNEFNMNCFALMKDGSLAFGGPDGLNVFDPKYFNKIPQAYQVYLTDVIIHQKKVREFNSFANGQKFYLQPHEKALDIEFTSTLYSQREAIHYFVMLENADPDWVDIGAKESVRYINLKPGKYQFKVKARDIDGEWSTNISEAGFIVIPSFYQTEWFLILCIFCFFALLYSLYLYRINQLRRLETIRNRISHDLHDDIGSTLGSISVYSEVAKYSSEKNRNEVLQKIGEGSREMLEKLNDIVWSINPENDHLDRMETRMRNFAAMALNPSGISFNISFNIDNPKQLISMEKRRNLFLIFKEALHNAVKYAQCKNINIKLEQMQGKVTLEIRDNGIGFDINNVEVYNGTGLKSMRERARSIGADISIQSTPGKGTAIIIQDV